MKTRAKTFLNDNIDILQIILDLIEKNSNDAFYYTIDYKVNQFYYDVSKDNNNLFTYGKLSDKQLAFISTFKSKMKSNLDKYNASFKDKLQSNYFGNVNEKYDLELTIKSVKEIETPFGYTFKHELIDTNKNLFVYFSASKNQN
jgi:hypothetical protein